MWNVSKMPCEVSCSPCAVVRGTMPTTWHRMHWLKLTSRWRAIRIRGNSDHGSSKLLTTPSSTTKRVAGLWKVLMKRDRLLAAQRPIPVSSTRISTSPCAPCRPRNVQPSHSSTSTATASRRLPPLPTHRKMRSSNNSHEDVTNLKQDYSYEQR